MRNPAELAALRTAVFRGIAANKEVKAIAVETKTAETYIYTMLYRADYEKMLLSPEERFAVQQMRAGKGKFVAKRK